MREGFDFWYAILDGQDPEEQGNILSSGYECIQLLKILAFWYLGTGQLKAKLAKLKRELLTPTSSGGGAGGKSY